MRGAVKHPRWHTPGLAAAREDVGRPGTKGAAAPSPSGRARILGRISPVVSRMAVTLTPGPSGAIRARWPRRGRAYPWTRRTGSCGNPPHDGHR
jgi:lipoprotein-anchoring transpeptidase ErfK/SrfK